MAKPVRVEPEKLGNMLARMRGRIDAVVLTLLLLLRLLLLPRHRRTDALLLLHRLLLLDVCSRGQSQLVSRFYIESNPAR